MLTLFKNHYSKIKHLLLISFLLLGCVHTASAQIDTLTVERQYELARQAAFDEENYDKARKLAYAALEKSPDYHGIRIFVARLYAWEGNYEESRKELNYVLERDPDNYQALTALIDVETWSENYASALELANRAIDFYPQDEDLLLKKASTLQNMNRPEDAEQVYLNILERHPGNLAARQGLQRLQIRQMNYQASLSYRHDRFGEIFDPWNFWEVQLSRQTGIGPVIGSVEYADRLSDNGVQFSLDAYPTLTKGLYAYLNAGYSDATIYPDFRFGLSLYKSLPSAFEMEGGFRYLNFGTSEITIYIASLSKYWGNYLFTGKMYLIPSSPGAAPSFTLLSRRYLGDAQTYLGLRGGFGTASADIQFSQDIQRLDSWSLSLEGQYPVSRRVYIGGNAGFDSEEFANFTRDRFSVKMYVSYRF